ncbi:oogenesis-related [Amia ocellicauda]|uniref:oogenesis-related n=1 Tax=Amia ocellicauda TaxID=2972642 RepID=UPI0034644683
MTGYLSALSCPAAIAEMTQAYFYDHESGSEIEPEVRPVATSGFLSRLISQLAQLWPFKVMVRALRGLAGLSPAAGRQITGETVSPGNVRHCRTGKKRLRRVTRLLLSVTPLWLQCVLGYPVCTSIGCSLSPEMLCSPTKPSGKGSKRKQDDLDEEEQQSWVEALTVELGDEDSENDPDYQPSTEGSTDSEENRTFNDTETDIEVEVKGDQHMIKDLPQAAPAQETPLP